MKLTKEILISYLYEELDETTRQNVENALEKSPEAQKDLEYLKESRFALQEIPTQKPTKPLFLGFEAQKTKKQPLGGSSFAKNTLAIAAALALLFIVAYLTNFRLIQHEKGFEISFGKIEKPKDSQEMKDFLEKKDIEKIIAEKLQENSQMYEQKLAALQMKNTPEVLQSNISKPTFDKNQMEELLSKTRKEDLKMMQEWLILNNQEQNEQIAKAFKNFAEYWEQKRQKDLQEIGEAYNYLKEQASEKFKENDIILARIIDSKK